jgi:hypothetical protein
MPLETIYICIRRTANWKDVAGYRARLVASLVPYINEWDATFYITYREFRAAIAEITMANLQAVRGAVIAPYEDIPEGAIVMPCDDDDWTAPHAAEILAESFATHHDRAVWTQSVLQVPLDWMHALKIRAGKIWPPLHPPRWFCSTNNYSLRKRAGNYNMFMSHLIASKELEGHAGLVRISNRLSLQNRNMASQTSIAPIRLGYLEKVDGVVHLTNFNDPAKEMREANDSRHSRRLLRKLEKYQELYQSYKPEHPDLEWATPYVHAMRDLTLSLKAK